MKNLVILLFVGVLLGSVREATAQGFLVPPADNDPPRLELPSEPIAGSGTQGSGTRSELSSSGADLQSTELIPKPIDSGDLQPSLQLFGSEIDLQIFQNDPALLESTGTWLRRGFWYSEVDVLVMDRIWRRDNFLLAFQADPNNTGEFGAENRLIIEGGRTGAEATPRLNLGRFLFRDHKNRDHTAEFIAFGGSQWATSGRLDATAGGSLTVGAYNIVESDVGFNVVRFPLDKGNISFDGATSTQYSYDSRFNSFELNYQVKSRMQKDRMELEPSGHWVRRAQPSVSKSLMAGIRYFDLNEDFDWDAFGIDVPGTAPVESETGNYRIRTDNDLIGAQLGFGWTYETSRWSLGIQSKNGAYLNHTNVDSSFEVTGGVTSGDNKITLDNLSFVSEGSLVGKWHLRPNFSLRAGMEIMYVSSVAHASEQLNFIPVNNAGSTVVNGDSTFMGGLVGFEGYW